MLTPHPLLVPRSKIEWAIPLLSLRALVVYERVKPTCFRRDKINEHVTIVSL
jgi:hypothetical protein